MKKFPIVALAGAQFVPDTDILALTLDTSRDGPIQLGLPPQALQSLALLFLQKLSEGADLNILPPQLHPKIQSPPRLRASPSEVNVDYVLSGGLRIGVEMSWPVARQFAERLTALCDQRIGYQS